MKHFSIFSQEIACDCLWLFGIRSRSKLYTRNKPSNLYVIKEQGFNSGLLVRLRAYLSPSGSSLIEIEWKLLQLSS